MTKIDDFNLGRGIRLLRRFQQIVRCSCAQRFKTEMGRSHHENRLLVRQLVMLAVWHQAISARVPAGSVAARA